MNGRSILFRQPVLHALAIQLVSIPTVATVLFLLHRLTGLELGIGLAAILQGTTAMLVSYVRRLPAWWLPLQWVLPPLAVLALLLQIPSWVFLAGFVVLLGIYWATLFTRVPLYSSGKAIRRAVAELLPRNRPVSFVDIGSGLGGVVVYLAVRRPDSHFTGIELAPLPWFVSRIRACFFRGRADMIRGDYNRLDLSRFDVVFAYLSPVVMTDVWKKARAEMRTGTLFLSCEFPVSGVEPDIVLQPKPGRGNLYCWKM